MCMKCVYAQLEQVHWELVHQENQYNDVQSSPEIVDTIKEYAQGTGCVCLPQLVLQKPNDMSPEEFQEAGSVFKQYMSEKRKVQLEALAIVMNLFETEILPFPDNVADKQMHINANVVLHPEEGQEEAEF